MAENMAGVGRFIRHFAYLAFNYGLGGGLISHGELWAGGYDNAGEFSGLYQDDEMDRRPALQFLLARLQQQGIPLDSVDEMCQRFDPQWPGVAEWVKDVTPTCNRLVNAISAIFNPKAIVFGGHIPVPLAEMLIANTVIYGTATLWCAGPACQTDYLSD